MIRVSPQHDLKNDLHNPADDCDPHIHKQTPKFILKSCRIFKPKDEGMTCQRYAAEEKHALGCHGKFQEEIYSTYYDRQWSNYVSIK